MITPVASNRKTVPLLIIYVMEEILVPIVFFLVAFGIVYVAVTAKNRERMAMIEKGIKPGESNGKKNTGLLLKWSLLVVGLGVGFFVANLLETYTILEKEPAYFGSVLLFGGLGLLLAYLILKKGEQAQNE